MFAVLKIVDPPKRGFFSFKKGKKYKLPRVLTDSVLSKTYFIIEAQKENNEVNWGKIQEVAGREATRLLIPRHLKLPKNCGIKPYKGEKYLQKIMMNTAFDIIKRSKIPPEDSVLCLYDYYAKCPEIAISLLKYAATVKVFTARANIYNHYNIVALGTLGTMFLISEKPPEASTFHLLLAPFGLCDRPLPPYDNPAIFIHNTMNKYIMRHDCVGLPDRILKHIPEGIEEAIFAAALYERGGLAFLGDKTAEILIKNEQKILTVNINLA